MKILFTAFHPADPHVVRYACKELNSRGHEILFAVVEKEEIISDLISSFGFNVITIGKNRKTLIGKIINVLSIDLRLLKLSLKFKPDIIFSPSSPYSGHIAKILRIKHICWGDTETATINLKASLPFIDSLLLPNCFYKKVSNKKVIYFNGYKEISYLHPNHFKSDSSILQNLGVKENEKIILMRFSALQAIHDIGLTSNVKKNSALILTKVHELSKYAKIFISCTEKDLGPEFNSYKLNIPPNEYINLLSFCSLYIGEGTTTASEAGVLGVPWIVIRPLPLGYLEDQEKNYNLGFRTDDVNTAFNTALGWIQNNNLKSEWAVKRKKLLDSKIDLTAFLIWFIENYPESHKIMRDNPGYQDKFL